MIFVKIINYYSHIIVFSVVIACVKFKIKNKTICSVVLKFSRKLNLMKTLYKYFVSLRSYNHFQETFKLKCYVNHE